MILVLFSRVLNFFEFVVSDIKINLPASLHVALVNYNDAVYTSNPICLVCSQATPISIQKSVNLPLPSSQLICLHQTPDLTLSHHC